MSTNDTLTSKQAYAARFKDVQDPARAATRAPAGEQGVTRVTRFPVEAETTAFLLAISRSGSSAMAAIVTWATATYLRKVARGDAIVLAVPAPAVPSSWVPVRCQVDLEEPPKASLLRIRDVLEELAGCDAADLVEVATALELPVSERDNGLCDTAVVFSGWAPLPLPVLPFPPSVALGLRFEVGEEGLRGELHWRSDCFDARDVEAMPGHFQTLLGALATGISRPLAGCSLLARAEASKLVELPNCTGMELEGPDNVPDGFAAVAARSPTKTAVIVGGEQISYAELAARAERVGAALLAAGVTPGSRVGLMARRDGWLAPALLGIMQAGCAYVPLDPDYPEERIRWILEDCRASAILASRGVPLPAGVPLTLRLEELPEPGAKGTLFPRVSAADAAYLIYTSGSTGKPKGVRIDHGNVVNFFAGMDAVLPHSEAATWLAITSISFDISVLELLWTLCRGMRVVLQDPGKLVEAVAPGQPSTGPTLSLFFFADCDADQASAQYDLLFRAAEFADREGMEAVWVPERHFHRFGGLFPNPSLAAAALAARTRRIAIRAGSVVAPLHHPLRIAEEWSFVDNISGGRVGVSFASGWNPRDFVLAPGAFAGRRETLPRHIDVVRRFWRGEAMTLPEGDNVHEVRLYPRPVQPELPVWITASNSIETFIQAGASGTNVLTHLLHHSFAALQEKIAAYRAAWREHHGDAVAGKVTLMVHTFIGDSEREVLDAVRGPFLRYLRSSADLMRGALPTGSEGANLSDEDKEAMVAAAFERYLDERGLFGTPETCLAKVRRLQEAGVDEIACLVDFIPDQALVYAHLPHLVALQSLVRGCGRPLDVAGQIETHRVTHFQCTPLLARALIEDRRFQESLRHLEVFAVGGEAFPAGLHESIREFSDAVVLNMYGPTETTIWSTVQRVEDGSDPIPIGRPIANTRVYVLAPDLSPLPANRPGELYIGGRGVAAGYWNRPELSAEKFIRDPFSSNPLDRLYRTGDLVRWDHDGQLLFLGRLDRQVKVRGHRVELGEIECCLRDQPGIREALVVTRKVGNSAHLCAYYRADAALREADLEAALAAALPAYMLPEFLIRVEAFPMTPNRKIDVQALPAPGEVTPQGEATPLDPVQAALLDIWKRVLGKENLGPHDDFFRSGGDSIQAIQATAQANAAGFSLRPKMIYEHVTVAALAGAVSRSSSAVSVEPPPDGPVDLLPAQRWFFGMEVPNRNHWNQSGLLGLRKEVRPAALRAAVEAAFARHPAFRLRFRRGDSKGWSQAYARATGLAYRSLTWDAADAVGGDADQTVEKQADLAHRSLDLCNGPLAVAVHLSGFPGGDLLLLAAHHLVVDGVSWRILLEDIDQSYAAVVAGGGAALPPAIGPHVLARLAAASASSTEGLAAQSFWKLKQSHPPEPIWNAAGVRREDECETWVARSHGPLDRDLDSASVRLNADTEALLLAAFVRAIRLAGIGNGFAVDMETHGRGGGAIQDAAAAAAVGWLTRIYPLVLPPGGEGPTETLRQVKAALREAAPHKDLFSPHHGALQAGEAAPQIIFNFLGRLDTFIHDSSLFSSLRLSPGRPRDPGAVRHHVLEVNVHQTAEGMVWEFIHPPTLLSREAVQQLAGLCEQSLCDLLGLSAAESADCLLSEDFPGSSLRAEEIRELAAQGQGLEDAYAATALQRAIFFQLHACPSDRSRFIHQALVSVQGSPDEQRLERALRAVAARHGAFRSTFSLSRSGVLVQALRREAHMPIRRMDWSNLPSAQQASRLAALRKLDLEQGMDPGRAPLVRAVLVRTAPDSSLLLWTYHHLIADGWSLSVVLRDLAESYATDQAPSAPAGDFGQFARWLGRVDRKAQDEFWARYLEGMQPPITLSPKGRKYDFSYRVEYGVLDESSGEDAMARWQRRAQKEGATFPALLQAAWGLALCRASLSSESSFGITVAGRPAEVPGVEHAVGLFINSVPVRFRSAPGDTPSSLIRRAHSESSALQEHAYADPLQLARLLGVQGGEIAFETVLVVQPFVAPECLQDTDGLRLTVLDFVERSSAPLTVAAVPGKRLSLQYIFDTRHFQLPQVLDLHRGLIVALEDLAGERAAPLPSVNDVPATRADAWA